MPSSGDAASDSDTPHDMKTTPELERGWNSASQHKGKSVYSAVAAVDDETYDNEKTYANASTSQLLAANENAQDDEGQRLLPGDGDKEEGDTDASTRTTASEQQGKGRFKLGAVDGALKHRRRQSKAQIDSTDQVLPFMLASAK